MTDGTSLSPDKVPIELVTPQEKLSQSIKTAKKIIDSLVIFATQHGIHKDKFANLNNVWVGNGFLLLPNEMMDSAIIETKGWSKDQAVNLRATTSNETGEVFAREEYADKVHDIAHESVHRAVILARNAGIVPSLRKQIAPVYDLLLTKDDELDPQSIALLSRPEKKDEIRTHFSQAIKQFDEGITEWVVQQANKIRGEGAGIISEADYKYPDQVKGIIKMIEKYREKSGLSEEASIAVFIEAALTGDISKIYESMGRYDFLAYLNDIVYTSHQLL